MYVFGDGVSSEKLYYVAQKLSLSVGEKRIEQYNCLDLPPEYLKDQVLVVGGLNAERLEKLIHSQAAVILEDGRDLAFGVGQDTILQSQFLLSFTTRSAYNYDYTHFLTQFLEAKGYHYKDKDAIALVLQEVISNAILHGNMAIKSIDRSSLEGLGKMQIQIAAALNSNEVAEKRVLVTFSKEGSDFLFFVRDQGVWQDVEKESDNVYGRGTSIIREYTSSYFIDKELSTASVTFKNLETKDVEVSAQKRSVSSIHDDERKDVNDTGATTLDEAHSQRTKYIYSLPILIVDDLLFNRQMIGSILKAEGYTSLHFAEDGIDALEKIEEVNPQILILDLMMPRMDGYEVCRQLRKKQKWKALPILIQTALESASDRNEAFVSGATDVVTKPINATELKSRMLIHLENRLLVNELEKYHNRLQEEFATAIKIQESIFPSKRDLKEAEKKYGVNISSYFLPSSELTGDMWGLLPDQSGAFGMFVADFSGHGVAAAVNTFRLESFIRTLGAVQDPSDALKKLTAQLQPVMMPGNYATMCYGIVDKENEKFIYAAAGSTPPLLIYPGGKVIAGDGSGIPLGIVKDASYDLRELPCPPGTIIFMFSDALTDNFCAEDDLTMQPIIDLIQNMDEPAAIISLLREHMEKNDTPVDDDLTLFAVQV